RRRRKKVAATARPPKKPKKPLPKGRKTRGRRDDFWQLSEEPREDGLTDVQFFENLCMTGESEESLAANLDVSVETLQRAVEYRYKMDLSDFVRRKRQIGRATLRTSMWTRALAGDVPLTIFLAKQPEVLGMKERFEHTG